LTDPARGGVRTVAGSTPPKEFERYI